jgi:hypothetical protein
MTRNQEEVERIKNERSMRSVVEMYGFQVNRGGFINCPFHAKDHTASLKIYPRSYYCYACGAYGDIFTFVQSIEGIQFKDAFEKLGGNKYEVTAKESSWLHHLRIQRQKKESKIAKLKQQYSDACQDMRLYRWWCYFHKPPIGCKSFEDWKGSDEWKWGFQHLQWAEYRADRILEELEKVEVS